MTTTVHPFRHMVDTFMVNKPLLPWSPGQSVRARGMTHLHLVGLEKLPVCLILPGLLNATGKAAAPTPCSHNEGRALPYHPYATAVERRR